MISRNDPCWCGSNKKWKKCHYPQTGDIDFLERKKIYKKKYGIILKTKEEIEGIRQSSKIAAKILDKLCKFTKKGVTTQEIDDLSMQLHKQYNAIPAPLGYGSPPFPKSVCTSINEVICHGIPDDQPLKEGDIINIDVTTIYNGYYGDTSRMVAIGEIPEERKLVMDTSYICMMEAIKICRPNLPLNKIAEVIEKIALDNNCSVVYQFVGHGVGIGFHEPPQIPFYYNSITIPLVEGMTFTIEPMINAGVAEAVLDEKTKWIAKTKDGKASGQWEHTILITKEGHEILTLINE